MYKFIQTHLGQCTIITNNYSFKQLIHTHMNKVIPVQEHRWTICVLLHGNTCRQRPTISMWNMTVINK